MVKVSHPGPLTEHAILKKRKLEDVDVDGSHVKKPRTRLFLRRVSSTQTEVRSSDSVFTPRKVPELCKAYTPGKTDQDISVRLARLERIIELALPQYANATATTSAATTDRLCRSSSELPDEDNRSIADEQDPSGGTFQSGKWYGNSASGSVAPASVLEQLANVVVGCSHRDQWETKNSITGHGVIPITHGGVNGVDHQSALAAPSLIESVRQDSEPSAADNLKSLVQECGVSPHKISELLQELPPQRFSDALIDHYFTAMSYLYHADRSYALVLGRPHAIQDDYTCTLPPLNIEEDFSPAIIRSPPPLSTPTQLTFVILRHQLASIIGRMVHHFQKVRTPSHYTDVLALDEELLKFINNLPPYFALEPDTSLDETKKFIPVHRFLLITETLFVRISLHRPYLLRRLSCDRYVRSRNACFESAMKDFQVRKAFRESVSNETRESLHNAYREFQTAMISGIYLVLYPHGKDSEMMHAVLDQFLKDHEGIRELDETTRRELKIIEFLKSRALQLAETTAEPTEASSSSTVDPQLTSGLIVSNARTSVAAPPVQPTFSSLLATTPTGNTASPQLSAALPYPNSPFAQSPAMQRLQQSCSTDGTLSSPAGTGSPGGEEESAAQSLLDRWCSTFNETNVEGMPALSWGGPGGADFTGWIGVGANIPPATDPCIVPGVNGSDWTYWETLVNQIKAGPL
ncbi:hypothetical protein ID866_6128 [Astraeus odoratus]|nr:hypothetical protein ID866_6128 [Astraeus odoratus]